MRFCLFASWMQFEVVKLAADCIRGQQPRCPVYLQCCLHCIAIAFSPPLSLSPQLARSTRSHCTQPNRPLSSHTCIISLHPSLLRLLLRQNAFLHICLFDSSIFQTKVLFKICSGKLKLVLFLIGFRRFFIDDVLRNGMQQPSFCIGLSGRVLIANSGAYVCRLLLWGNARTSSWDDAINYICTLL
jgi:hypothetical protein